MAANPEPRALYAAVSARLAAEPPARLAAAPGGDPLLVQLAAILAQTRAVAAALDGLLPGGGVDDLNKYDYLAAEMERIAAFQSFSLAEYTYHLPDGRRPGVRLWLEEDRWRRFVRLLWFPAVGRWRADAAGRKLTRDLLSLELGPQGISTLLAPDLGSFFEAAWGWQECLAMALCLAVESWDGES